MSPSASVSPSAAAVEEPPEPAGAGGTGYERKPWGGGGYVFRRNFFDDEPLEDDTPEGVLRPPRPLDGYAVLAAQAGQVEASGYVVNPAVAALLQAASAHVDASGVVDNTVPDEDDLLALGLF